MEEKVSDLRDQKHEYTTDSEAESCDTDDEILRVCPVWQEKVRVQELVRFSRQVKILPTVHISDYRDERYEE